jgi:hypothetical protein
MTGIGPHLRIIHDSQHAPSLAAPDYQITQPSRTTSQPAAVVLAPQRSLLISVRRICRNERDPIMVMY